MSKSIHFSFCRQTFNYNLPLRALASGDAKKKKNFILHSQTPFYQFYHSFYNLPSISVSIFTYNSLKQYKSSHQLIREREREREREKLNKIYYFSLQTHE